MTARMQDRARVLKTLLVRVHRCKSVGKNRDMRGSNSAPRPEANAHSRSIAAPESLLRSEHMALLIGRETVRINGVSSTEKSQAPFLQRFVKRIMPFAMVSHDSSDSTRAKTGRRASTSCLKVFRESHYKLLKKNRVTERQNTPWSQPSTKRFGMSVQNRSSWSIDVPRVHHVTAKR